MGVACDRPTFTQVKPLVLGHLLDVVPPSEFSSASPGEGAGGKSSARAKAPTEVYHLLREKETQEGM